MDRIEKITIENYKSIDHCSIDNCNEINLLVGPPNSGKSNIIENLCVFTNQFYYTPSLLKSKENEKFQVGKLESLQKQFRFSSPFNLFKKNKAEFPLTTYTSVIFNNDFSLKSEIILSDKIIEEHVLRSTSSIYVPRHYINKIEDLWIDFYHTEFEKIGSKILYYKFKAFEKNYSYEKRQLFPIYGENLGEVIYFNEELKLYIQKELEKIGMSLSIIINDKPPRAQLTDKNGVSILFDFYMLADTFQRIVFYKAAILSNKETILLFEEPEAHCYEPYMIDFVNDILNSGNDNQYFIVTHSDFILQEFLRDEENRHRTNIYIVKNEPNQGTKVKLIDKENKDVYNYGMNVFFNFDSLWAETKN